MMGKRKICDVVTLYTKGTHEGNVAKLNKVFYENTVMNGFFIGKLIIAAPEYFIEDMKHEQLKNIEDAYSSDIIRENVDGDAALVTLKN